MQRVANRSVVLIVAVCVLSATAGPADPLVMGQDGLRALNARVEVQRFDEEACWYRRELQDGEHEYVLVDAATGARSALFDHTRPGSVPLEPAADLFVRELDVAS